LNRSGHAHRRARYARLIGIAVVVTANVVKFTNVVEFIEVIKTASVDGLGLQADVVVVGEVEAALNLLRGVGGVIAEIKTAEFVCLVEDELFGERGILIFADV